MRSFVWILLLMMAMAATGCTARYIEGPPPGWQADTSPEYLQDRVRILDNDGERNWVLHLNEITTASLRRGDIETAKRALDEAILQINVIYGNSDQARQARTYWRSEGRKVFKGDPYERSMVFFYRGVLYMQDQDWDNARACFRSALFQDSIAEEQNYESDWALFYYLIGVCEIQLYDYSSADDAFKMAEVKYFNQDMAVAKGKTAIKKNYGDQALPDFLPAFSRESNLLVITQQGEGPRKESIGEFGELLSYKPGINGGAIPRLVINNQELEKTFIMDSVTFQAQTRGGRPLDSILKGQAKFKETGEEFGVVGTQAGTAVLLSGGHHKSDGEVLLGAALIGAGAISYGISSLVRPQADTRAWKTLPETIAVSANTIDSGVYELGVQYPRKDEIIYNNISIPEKGDGLEVVLVFPPY